MSCSATSTASLLGMAKPTPMLPLLPPAVAMALFTPTTRPARSTSAPPLIGNAGGDQSAIGATSAPAISNRSIAPATPWR